MSKAKDTLLSLTLVALVFSGPAAVAAYLLTGDNEPTPLTLATSHGAGTPSLGTIAGSAPPVLAGVLYTSGTAVVDWNGQKIPIDDGSYAYLGGEMVSTGPDAMGVLQLDGDNRVYVCPGSRMSLSRAADGAYRIRISEGGGRIAFGPGTDYRIEANQGVVTPGPGADSEPSVAEVSVFQRHPGGVVCGFSSSTEVAAYPSQGGAPIALGTAGPGQIIDLSRALRDEAAESGAPVIMQPIAMPAEVHDWLRRNAPYPPKPGPIGYLCRCEQLKRYADADGIPDAAIAPLMTPPDSLGLAALPLLESAPPVVPPSLPPVILAAPVLPEVADPAVLRGPDPARTVPPPLVPVAGSGGGVTSTPS